MSDMLCRINTHRLSGACMTMVINALTERKGVKVGLLTTKGLRDTLEIARGNRSRCGGRLWQERHCAGSGAVPPV